jgi:6-phosphogluconate dehydrogenase
MEITVDDLFVNKEADTYVNIRVPIVFLQVLRDYCKAHNVDVNETLTDLIQTEWVNREVAKYV